MPSMVFLIFILGVIISMYAINEKCPVCDNNASINPSGGIYGVQCDTCGYFVYKGSSSLSRYFDIDELRSYLYYNRRILQLYEDEPQYCYIRTRESYDSIPAAYQALPVVDVDTVGGWYPKLFSERIDIILLGLWQRASFPSEEIKLTLAEKYSAFFVQRINRRKDKLIPDLIANQVEFIRQYLEQQNYIRSLSTSSFLLLADGYKRVDDIQKYRPKTNKDVFVAMSFDPKAAAIREAIRCAIVNAHFNPIIMDEVEHNHQIVPEMLHQIRQARFVIAELSEHNNGAYYEAGYAYGLGKEVIHVCNEEALNSGLHFDVKQVNTVKWTTPDDIKERLQKRIEATIQ